MNTQPSQLVKDLKAVRALLTSEDNWTQRSYARSADGVSVDIFDAHAVCFCLSGALRRVVGPDPDRLIGQQWGRLYEGLDALNNEAGTVVSFFNDNPKRTHAQILRLLDRTIGQIEARA